MEHHLFPRLPRHNLRAAREMVREVVHKHFPPGSVECNRLFPFGKAYHEPGFFAGNVEMWWALKRAALAARKTLPRGASFGAAIAAISGETPPNQRRARTSCRIRWRKPPSQFAHQPRQLLEVRAVPAPNLSLESLAVLCAGREPLARVCRLVQPCSV